MALQSIPPLISALFMFALGLIAILLNRKDRINLVFGLFSFALSLSAGSAFFFYEIETYLRADHWARIPFAFAIPASIFALYYILMITEYDQYLKKGQNKKIFRFYIFGLFLYGCFIEIITLVSGLNIAGVHHETSANFQYVYGRFYVGTVAGLSLITITAMFMLISAYRKTTDSLKRVKLFYNLIGFSILYIPAGIMRIYLPYFGLNTISASYIPFTLSAFIFLLAILRYQIRQIEIMNQGLENKIMERTRELQTMQANLVQSEKMAALGRLVAGLSHELNTPLGVITSNNDSLTKAIRKLFESLDPKPKNELHIGKIFDIIENILTVNKTSAQQLTGIVTGLKNFIRLDEAEVKYVNFHDGINSTLALLKYKIKNRIKIEKEFGDIPNVKCRPNQINQVFMNIILNAIEAIPGKGIIKISTGRTENDFVWINIADSGPGISPAHREQIFDPGFTTKGVGYGSGLGLAISYQIIKHHHGKISVESHAGTGSVFTIELPLNAVPA